MNAWRYGLATSALLWSLSTPGSAACLRIIGVPTGDVLNLRALPSPASDVVRAIDPRSPGILVLKRPCTPSAQPRTQQWCRVRSILGTRLRDGFVNARFVELTPCP